jgi:hypothetical protein
MWCGNCYTSDEEVLFHVRQDPRLARGGSIIDLADEDRLGNVWRASPPDPLAFHYARDGEHLMVSFECDHCVFSKIRRGERPNLSYEPDKLLMACIRRVILDSFWSRASRTVSSNRQVINRRLALYEVACQVVLDSRGRCLYHDDHKQFDTVRVFRTAYHNQAACSVMNSGSILSLGNEKGEYQRFAREATASVWYQRFSQGCKKRMGQDWRPNRALSNELVHRLLAVCKERYKSSDTFDTSADWVIAGSYFATGYVCSLRGPEGLLVDLEELPGMIIQTNPDEIVIFLLGKVKGETNARHHKLFSVAVTSSGIDIKNWYQRSLVVHHHYGRTTGPAMCDSKGLQLLTRDLNLKFWEALGEVWQQEPELFGPDIKTFADIELIYNVFRSLRRGSDSRAIEQGLSESVINTVNRWHLVEKSGGARPVHRSMNQYYADANLLKAVHLEYTASM